MDVSYSSGKLRKQCEQESVMRRTFDEQTAKKLKMRLNELQSARTLGDVFEGPGRWELLSGNWKGYASGRLTANDRLIVAPLVEGDRLEPVRGEDWAEAAAAVTEVEVSEIVDYH
jgi:Txe/YoeB family toxin of Txe-Axe toxin-antitoxin module